MVMRTLTVLAATAAVAALASPGVAGAQSYGPRPAYAVGGYDDCGGGRFTLLGAHAGVTVLGVDVGASAGLHVGLHDRCRGGAPVVYAPPPAEYGPPGGYGPPPGYGDVGYPALPEPAYAQPAYPQPAYPAPSYGAGGYGAGGYGAGGYGYVYAGQAAYGYRSPCGC